MSLASAPLTGPLAAHLPWIREQFPSLALRLNGHPAVYFDGPGGTQVPQRVIDAMTDYLLRSDANTDGAFETSRRTDFVWDGNYYALNLRKRLGVEDKGSMVRVGLAPYNAAEEVDRLLKELKIIAQ